MTIHQWDNTLGRPIMKYFPIMNYQPSWQCHMPPFSLTHASPSWCPSKQLGLTRIFPFQALSLSLYYLCDIIISVKHSSSYQLIASPYHAWFSHYLTCLLHILHGTENYIWNYVIHLLVSFCSPQREFKFIKNMDLGLYSHHNQGHCLS